MKKLGLLFKETSAKHIKDNLKASNSIFIVRFSGLSSPDFVTLRRALRNSKANLFVVKNNVARSALKDSGLESLCSAIEGPCGLVFVKDEPVDASRTLYNFSREHEQLKLEAGFLKDKILNKKDIETLARLPAKEVLRATTVLAIKAPISKLVYVLNENLRKIVYCLEQIKNKKGD